MPCCAVIKCNSRSKKDSGLSLFRVPKISEREGPAHAELLRKRRAQWIANISRADLDARNEHIRVCNKHFLSGKPSSNYDVNNPDWAPTLNMGHNKIRDKSSVAMARYGRMKKRKEMKKQVNDAHTLLSFHKHFSSTVKSESSNLEQDGMEELPISNGTDAEATDTDQKSCNKECQTDTDQNSCSQECQTDITHKDLKQLNEEMQHLRDELYKLREQNSNSAFSENGFKDKDDKVKFYTGLPTFKLLKVVFNFLAPHIEFSHRNSLSPFQEFILVLMRLRLNLVLRDLAYRFDVSVASTSRMFQKWVNVMDIRLKHLIHGECAIGAVRQNYKILGSSSASELVTCNEGQLDPATDKLVRVCSSLTNLSIHGVNELYVINIKSLLLSDKNALGHTNLIT